MAQTPLREAIAAYHELLTEQLAADSWAQLEDQLHRRGLYFGERPLCTVLRPRFLTPEHYAALQRRVSVLLGAFDKAYRAALADPAVRAQFAPTEWEEELLRDDPGFRDPSPTGRLDTFIQTDPRAAACLRPVVRQPGKTTHRHPRLARGAHL